jgi:hypothetical protein
VYLGPITPNSIKPEPSVALRRALKKIKRRLNSRSLFKHDSKWEVYCVRSCFPFSCGDGDVTPPVSGKRHEYEHELQDE